MSHLLAISVGPIQEFIAAARRTRDLWFGSYLLSEISKAVARSVRGNGRTLIFPHPDSDLDARSDLNVANVILAELDEGDPKEVAKVAAEAKEAAQNRWLEFADEARKEAADVIRTNIWDDQVGDVIEFYAAWVASSGGYSKDRARVMRLLAGRKNCRDFKNASQIDAGLPKSSLDGQRSTVLVGPKPGEKAATYRDNWLKEIRRKLRVRTGEQLDVVGVVKRIGEGNKPYPSVSRIAADPWIRGNKDEPAFKRFRTLIEQIHRKEPNAVHRLDTNKYRRFEDFPYEGTAVYPSRHHEWLQETGLTEDDLKPLREALKELPDANPYLAVLVADGDKMGEAISVLDSAKKNREFSQALAGFAGEAKEIVERHQGVLVYAGGDDVLAFVPVDRCLECARNLHDKFGTLMHDHSRPALSVGVAIGHFLENLEILLDYGRAAEKDAKQPDRNGLAVHLLKRGGAPIMVRDRWEHDPDVRLTAFADMLNRGAIPMGLPYELQNMAVLYKTWPAEKANKAIRQDVLRLIAKKQPTSGSVGERLAPYLVDLDASRLRRLAEELLVARQVARALRQATRQEAPAVEVAS